jgi:hypothetical protein
LTARASLVDIGGQKYGLPMLTFEPRTV